ncbi:hypothetical protein L1987_36568 [Smallanthus sonchifolius]|uniref:Uncharacterized protein n=1 Tax=Smallanthus sonchifolius TaxID=185202 RepID=A0ACB9HFA9_9ASTR|nr:hypothetical protein L1987_36568 [Smallanthus sonchifolius]
MQQEQIDELGFCPSFSCYSSDSLASTAAATISSLQQQRAARFHEADEDQFEFSLVLGDEELSADDIASDGRTVFPLFNRDILIQNEVDRVVEEEIGCSVLSEKKGLVGFFSNVNGSGMKLPF